MAVFKVETKNKVDIDKKPRVYFTCHPDDFDKYFKKICDDTFKTHDCAIYYTEDMTEIIAEDEKQVDLGRNNLFVVPVTFKLLSTPNRAMDEDIPYALKEHIPVLPIMMEPGIDEFYSKPDKFGELQYLNPYSTDLTEISYEEKLKRYLESVLISDELAKRVRAAFDAYIFLSYRKKDRKYANELMRLIHSNPECRDIAIWFDEFLTPGENFKENIEKILDDCKLFTLLVTPQLLEKVVDENGEERDNYVISTELPLARKKKEEKGTDIFAVEMEKTDREALSAISIEDYTNPENADFRARLLETISRMAIATNNTPEHNFLIGLAYLEGIDVEVDREQAVELITSAAEDGLVEAMEKLAVIFNTGIGVDLDCNKAVEWQQKVVDVFEQEYSQNSSKITAENLGNALVKLGIYAYEAYDKDVFVVSKKRCIEILKVIQEKYGIDYRYQLSICYQNLGSWYMPNIIIHQSNLAEKYYLAALDLRKQLALESKKHLADLARTYRGLGETYNFLGKPNESERMFLAALDILNNLSGEEIQIAQTYHYLGNMYRRYKKHKKAIEQFLQCVTILQSPQFIIREEDEIVFILSTTYENLAELYLQERQFEEAKRMAVNTIELNIGACLELLSKYKKYNLNGVQYKTINEYAKRLSKTFSILEKLHDCFVDNNQIIELYLSIIEVYIQVRTVFPEAIGIPELASFYHNTGNHFATIKDLDKAIEMFENAIELYKSISYSYQLSYVYNDYGVLQHNNKNYLETEKAYSESIELRKQVYEIHSEKCVAADLATSFSNMGILCMDLEKYDEAEKFFLEAIESCKSLTHFDRFIKNHIRLGDLYRLMNQFEKSEQMFLTAIDYSKQQPTKEAEIYEPLLADALDGLACLYRKVNKQKEAEELRAEAIQIAKRYPRNKNCMHILTD